jgi:hypothetical protein
MIMLLMVSEILTNYPNMTSEVMELVVGLYLVAIQAEKKLARTQRQHRGRICTGPTGASSAIAIASTEE